MSKRRDTSVESFGAEHLVMGYLMREGIQTYMADQRQEGYDLICLNPQNNKMVKVQVKSRWATDCDRAFPLKSENSDFVAVVFLNNGPIGQRKITIKNNKRDPEFYIIPTKTCITYRNEKGWKKINTKKIPDLDIKFKDNWELIKKKLKISK
jgi:hypothetical protein